MKSWLIVLWLALPVVGLAYHWGPGQTQTQLDQVDQLLREADALAQEEIWAQAVLRYEAALERLPEDRQAESQRIRLELAKAQMQNSQLPQAHDGLQSLVDELQASESADAGLLSEARAAYANSQFYMTWLMRLEGRPEEDWRAEIDSAEQTLRLLAEQSSAAGQADAADQHQQDLEAAIKLARMDLSELQGLPLPSQ